MDTNLVLSAFQHCSEHMLLCVFLTFNKGDTNYHGGLRLCKRYPLTRGCSRGKSLFLNFAENAKVAATGFERETRGDLTSLSNSSSLTKRSRPSRPTLLLCVKILVENDEKFEIVMGNEIPTEIFL